MSAIIILSPLDGWCSALDSVPDEVFSTRLLGDGLAIDPVRGSLLAPCGGEIVTLPASAHAVSIRTPEGIDLLLHIGIDTVGLAGRGFRACVSPGELVTCGQELIRFDLDVIVRGAKSLLTPVVVTTEGLDLRPMRGEGVIHAGDPLFEISRPSSVSAAPAASAAGASQRTLIMPLQQGLHARPAALLSQAIKPLAAEVSMLAHGRTASGRSVVAMMSLGVRQGDSLTVRAIGPEAARAIEAIEAALRTALKMESVAGHAAPAATPPARRAAATDTAAGTLSGITAVPGFAVGRVARIERRELAVEEHGTSVAIEGAHLDEARANVRKRLTRVGASGDATRRAIVEAHIEFLDDPVLNEAAQEYIAAGKSAAFAWRGATRRQVAVLEALDDRRLRERADDLLDVESHVLLALSGEARPLNLIIPQNAVIVADDLLPSELTSLDRERLAALCLVRGGATSHVAILAAAMDLPMLVGLGDAVRGLADGVPVIVDADAGVLIPNPDAALVERARISVATRAAGRVAERAAALAECRTLDGTRIEIFANLGSVADAVAAVANGAEGCGLLRSEFLFIDRDSAPDEAEQLAAYQAISCAMGARAMVLRLMDVGGDKPLRYLPLPHEDNPALGLRGIRTALARPDLLRVQLRAALQVAPHGIVQLLVPMVTDVAEILAVRAVIDELSDEFAGGQKPATPLKLGAMIETPAAALNAAGLLRAVDFLSIGSNDLTQYTLAMDRGHPELARRADALHPAVLKLISWTATAGTEAGKTVAVCGGVAADRLAVPILLGLGVRELSVVPAAIPAIKRQIRTLHLAECRELALRCLELESAAAVRDLVMQGFDTRGETP